MRSAILFGAKSIVKAARSSFRRSGRRTGFHTLCRFQRKLAIIDAIPARYNREHVFGEGDGGFSGWSKAKASLDKRIEAARINAGKKTMAAWVIHDLRRSVITHMNERGFAAPHVIEAVVNHVSGTKAGVAGLYNRASYAAEKRRGLRMGNLPSFNTT